MSYAHETCCAHLKIQYCKESFDGLTHDWWECASCRMLFAPQGRTSRSPHKEAMSTRDALNRLRSDPAVTAGIAENASAQQMLVLLRALLEECRPHVERGREVAKRELMFAGGIASVVSRATHERDACGSLLARIDAAVKR